MPISSGPNREDIRPYEAPSGTRNILGNHRRHSAALNVHNPQANTHYVWEAATRDKVLSRQMRGYRVVGPDDPERKGLETDLSQGLPLDMLQARQDVVLMKAPEDVYRTIMEQKAQDAQAAMATANEYLSKGQPLTHRYGKGSPIYYQKPEHKTGVEEY